VVGSSDRVAYEIKRRMQPEPPHVGRPGQPAPAEFAAAGPGEAAGEAPAASETD
jgi:hypothetical protein